MRRREFITLFGSAATGWPLVARAQQRERLRLVCILEGISADTPGGKARHTAFEEGLQQLGWTPGRNMRFEERWGGGDEAATRKYAAELVALAPDVLVAGGGAVLDMMLKVTNTIPIVFAIVPDPVGASFVESLSRPGANATGFMMFEYNLCGKWLELLKEIAPSVTHAAVFRDASAASGIGQFAVLQSVAPSVGIEVTPWPRRLRAALCEADSGLSQPASRCRRHKLLSQYGVRRLARSTEQFGQPGRRRLDRQNIGIRPGEHGKQHAGEPLVGGIEKLAVQFIADRFDALRHAAREDRGERRIVVAVTARGNVRSG